MSWHNCETIWAEEKSEHFYDLSLPERQTGPQVVISKRKITAPWGPKVNFPIKKYLSWKSVIRFWFMPPHRLTPPFFSRYRTETEVTLFLIQYNSSRIWTLWASSCMPVDYGSMTHVPSQTSKIYWEHPFNSSLPRFYYGMKFLRWLLTSFR